MERMAAQRPLSRGTRGERRPGLTLGSITGFGVHIAAAVGIGLLVEAGWYWYVLAGHSAAESSGAHRDPLEAALVAALLFVLAGTLVAGRSLGKPGTPALLYMAVVMEFGLLTLVTCGLTVLGLTMSGFRSGYPEVTREIPLFSISFGVAFCAGLLMMLDAIAGRDSAGARLPTGRRVGEVRPEA